MRRMIQVGAGLLLMVAIASPLTAQSNAYTEGSGIEDSPHDFSDGLSVTQGTTAQANTEGTWNSTAVICEVCHTPHNAQVAQPLWDHTVTGVTTFAPYFNATIDAYVSPGPQPAGVSKLCLSCHDGVTNIDAFGGGAGSITIGAAGEYGGSTAAVNFTTDLSDDHPISFTYDGTLATDDGELHPPTTTASGITGSTGNIDDDMLFGSGNDQVECASCHDVHNKKATPGWLLVKTNASSALCLTCHNK